MREIIRSKGLPGKLANDYQRHLGTEEVSSESTIQRVIAESREQSVIWIRNTSIVDRPTDLDHFARNLDGLDRAVTLITSDGDRPVPGSYREETVRAILDSPMIVQWKTQNYDASQTHPKLSPYPIGMDLHTPRLQPRGALSKVDFMIELARRYRRRGSRTNKLFCDAHLTPSSDERSRFRRMNEHNPHCVFLEDSVSVEEILELYASHQFVVSPSGNGLDCHRTWEVLLTGGIVVTQRSSLDPLYEGLPVALVEDWDECTESNLKRWRKELGKLTAITNIRRRLSYRYWIGSEYATSHGVSP